jgi:glycosyltransferase involved in cell wall biosynthesis
MRVCIVTVASYAHGIGGMQAHTVDLGRGLVRAGHEVEVITARHPEGETESDYAGFRWHFVDARSRRARLPMRSPDWLRLSAETFERLHHEHPFDVVHSESTSALGLLRLGVQHYVPVAVKFHGNYLGLARAALHRAVSTPGARIREAKHLIWISGQHFVPLDTIYRFRQCEAMVPSRQQLAGTSWSYLLGRSDVHVVPNGVDAALFRPRPQAEARAELGLDGGPILVAAGRLNLEKGFDHALRAAAALSPEFPGLRLVIVGSGEERAALDALAADLELGSKAIFVGGQPRERMPLYLSASDVFLFPTERDEAAPLVLPEAMATGTPVVASEMGGIPEVIGPSGEAGVLVSPGDGQALVSAVGRLLRDPIARERMGATARARIVAEYTTERMVERALAVYELAAARLQDSAGAPPRFRRVEPRGRTD